MKRKKVLSTVATGALVMAMSMPVMAAPNANGGEFDVNLTTKNAVVRVVVPTSMAIAIDQFEITHTGNQIESSEFNMTNKSEINVKVTVTSTAVLDDAGKVTLVPTAQEAIDSKSTDGVAWLAVAAKTNDGSTNSNKFYDDLTTGATATPPAAAKVEEFWELTDANANVTSFSAAKKAEQTFYLKKASGTYTYTLAVPDDTNHEFVEFAKYYELEEILAANLGDLDALKAQVKANDVYVVANGDVSKDGAAVTKLGKGTQDTLTAADLDTSAKKYYTAVAAAAAVPLGAGKTYVYGTLATPDAAGAAGFTYIGKLSGNEKIWTNSDIKTIKVAYTITGVTGTRYDEVKDDCTYGLYKEDATTTPTVVAIKSGATAVTSGSADAQAGITHTATLTNGTDTEIVIDLPTGNTIKNVFVAGSQAGLDGNTENTARAAISGNKVVLKGDSDWATGSTSTKYAKIVVGPSTGTPTTYIIKINVN